MHELIERLRNFHSDLLRAIRGVDESDLHRPEREGAWSISNVIAHLGDLELVSAARLSAIIADEEPHLMRFDQERWVAMLHDKTPTSALAERFWMFRRHNLNLLSSFSEQQLTRTGLHAEFGRMSVADVAELLDRHQRKHLAQIERIKTNLGLLSAADEPWLAGVEAALRPIRTRQVSDAIAIEELWLSGDRRALRVTIGAGATWPVLDEHVPGAEEVYVVAGSFDDGNARYGAGTFVHHPAGTAHVPRTEDGCTLFVFYPEG